MSIQFHCGRCGGHYKVADDWAGKRVRCKRCGQELTVPGGRADLRGDGLDADTRRADSFTVDMLAGLEDGRPMNAAPSAGPLPPLIPLQRPRAARSGFNKPLLIGVSVIGACILLIAVGAAVLILHGEQLHRWWNTTATGLAHGGSQQAAADRTIPSGAMPHRISLVDLVLDGPGEDHDLVELTDFEVIAQSLGMVGLNEGHVMRAWVILRPTPAALKEAEQRARFRMEPIPAGVVLRMDCFKTREEINRFLESPRVIGCLTGRGDPLIEDAKKFGDRTGYLTEMVLKDLWVIDLNKMPLPGAKPWWPSEQAKARAEYDAKQRAEKARQRQIFERNQAEQKARSLAEQARRNAEAAEARRDAATAAEARRQEEDRHWQQIYQSSVREHAESMRSRYPPLDLTGTPAWATPASPADQLNKPITIGPVVMAGPRILKLVEYDRNKAEWRGDGPHGPMTLRCVVVEETGSPRWPQLPNSIQPGEQRQPGAIHQMPFTRGEYPFIKNSRHMTSLQYVGRADYYRVFVEAQFPEGDPSLLPLMDAAARSLRLASTEEQAAITQNR